MGFKKKDLEYCAICNRGMAHGGNITFYQVTAQHYGLDPRGIRETHGMEVMMGGGAQGAALASIMGTDPDIAQPMGDRISFLVCEPCALEAHALLPRAMEVKSKSQEDDEGEDDESGNATVQSR